MYAWKGDSALGIDVEVASDLAAALLEIQRGHALRTKRGIGLPGSRQLQDPEVAAAGRSRRDLATNKDGAVAEHRQPERLVAERVEVGDAPAV